jgi:DNA-binding CsgD family transcriptional regulator
VTKTLIAEFASRCSPLRKNTELLGTITPREQEVLLLVARGGPTAEIADRTPHERGHGQDPCEPILTKLGARDRAQLVVIAYESGLATAR